MSQIEVLEEIPPQIIEGLVRGIYERIGGAIFEVTDQQIVALLRGTLELTGNLALGVLSPLTSVFPMNLAISTMDFNVVRERLDTIENHLKEVQKKLDAINYKIDLSRYSKFQSALEQVAIICNMKNEENRKDRANLAVCDLIEARSYYLKLAENEINYQSQIADDYLYTLCLFYCTEAWCFLELEELETAYRQLQKGRDKLRPLFEKQIETLLTSNPAAYLHPSLKEHHIDLKRLTKIYRCLKPGVDENKVFEMQRDNLFELAKNPEKWKKSLPPAILLPAKSSFFSSKHLIEFRNFLSAGAKRLKGVIVRDLKTPSDDLNDDMFALLPSALESIELMVEQFSRFETYLAEIQAIQNQKMSFQQWRDLTPRNEMGKQKLYYISLPSINN